MPLHHWDALTEQALRGRQQTSEHYHRFIVERAADAWFAALVSTEATDAFSIHARFQSWNELLRFLEIQEAVVEVWSYGQAPGEAGRRLTAFELADRSRRPREQPVFVTVTFREEQRVLRLRLEFGLHAARTAFEAHHAYQRQRQLQERARQALRAGYQEEGWNALPQWLQIRQLVEEDRIPSPDDLFVAVEYEVDEQGMPARIARFYKETEIEPAVRDTGRSRPAQILRLRKHGNWDPPRVATGYRLRGVSDQLEPLANPVPGQDYPELRIENPAQPDPRKWNLLEFGEPELVRQAALSKFSLLSAHLERERKRKAIRKSNYDLVAEPIILALNVGGGLAGAGFPMGEAARLAYNVITPPLLADVPTVAQLRELFALMAAKEQHPHLRTLPEQFLSPRDIAELRAAALGLTDAELKTYLDQVQNEDLLAMLRLPRMAEIDGRVSNLLNIMTSAFKVTEAAEENDFLRAVFNNIFFSPNGELNLKSMFAVAIGHSDATPRSGASLEHLSKGGGPTEAWLQYLEISVDIRAVINTLVRFTKPTLGEKELEKPFPYAPRMSDLAAYEIRVFGFPLLMFHKRGLLKQDYRAFENDYAYGFIGAKLVEHFPTREAMEEEIRAGRMFPLGYVKVPNGIGGWKPSNLALFAHTIPSGKYRGKTSVIVYGLQAYEDHSEYIQRELDRLHQHEQVLVQGGTIQQIVDGPPGTDRQPRLRVGSEALRDFTWVLGGLLELRRHRRLQKWGLTSTESERRAVASLAEELRAWGVDVSTDDPLLGIDKFNSSLLYAALDSQVARLTVISSMDDLRAGAEKADTARRIEELRRQAAGTGRGIVYLNQALEQEGRYEIGPLLVDDQNEVIGSGVRDVEVILQQLEVLPVADRARLRYNNYGATLLDLDTNGDGQPEKIFLTIEFPPGQVRRRFAHPRTGQEQLDLYEKGRWTTSITPRRLTELQYDAGGNERGSRTYLNSGTLDQPVRGPLLEETATLELWWRDLSQPGIDPYAPVLSKLHVNYVLGEIRRETYGLFPLPIERVDERFVARHRFDSTGILLTSEVFQNGATEEDFNRPLFSKLTQPLIGPARYTFTPDPAPSTNAALTRLIREDLTTGQRIREIRDNANFGRQSSVRWTDPFDGSQSFSSETWLTYADDFHFGLVPQRTVTRALPSGRTLSEAITVELDAAAGRRVVQETDYTGRQTKKTWNAGWEQPVVIETALRITTNQFSLAGTELSGRTVAKASGEEIATFLGIVDPSRGIWEVSRHTWYRPGVLMGSETNVYSPFGRLIATRLGGGLERRPLYDEDGIEQESQLRLLSPDIASPGMLILRHSAYQWEAGQRRALVERFIDGQAYDSFWASTDAEGRTMVDEIREVAGQQLRRVIRYADDSDRVLATELLQNDQLRARDDALEPIELSPGNWLLPVRVQPYWGLVSTNYFALGAPLARPVWTGLENGHQAEVIQWYPGTTVPSRAHLKDGQGRVYARIDTQLNAGVSNDIPYDLSTRFNIDYWGQAGRAQRTAMARGTDLALFADLTEGRLLYDLASLRNAPRFLVDPSGQRGASLGPPGQGASNVLALYRSSPIIRVPPGAEDPESVILLEQVDLRSFFFPSFSRQLLDRAGNVLEERSGRLEIRAGAGWDAEQLLASLDDAIDHKRYTYRYAPGWMVEEGDPLHGRAARFVSSPPPSHLTSWPVNQGARETPTLILGDHVISSDPRSLAGRYVFSRAENLRVLHGNPHLPGQTNVWTTWTTFALNNQGETLSQTETIYDASGNPSVTHALKRNSAGRPAHKITYTLPPNNSSASYPLVAGTNQISLHPSGAPLDWSSADFVGCYWTLPPSARACIEITDERGAVVLVLPALPASTGPRSVRSADVRIQSWPLELDQTLWLPGEAMPERGAALTVLDRGDSEVMAVALPALGRAGIDLRRIRSVVALIEAGEVGTAEISPLVTCSPLGQSGRFDRSIANQYQRQDHANGLVTFLRWPENEAWPADKPATPWEARVKFEGRPIAIARAGDKPRRAPMLIMLDTSDPHWPRPLYALGEEHGTFLKYFRNARLGDAEVYTVARSFETPRLEIFRAGILDDEISPGVLAFGHGYHVTVPLAKGGGGFSGVWATLLNRFGASVFRLGGDLVIESFFKLEQPGTELRRLTAELSAATTQAAEINQLPTLAEALLPRRALPWGRQPATPTAGGLTNLDLAALANRLEQHRLRFPQTSLIPTAPNTPVEHLVDTTLEAALIELAIQLDRGSMAIELLQFYWERSEGGSRPLHDFYDARTGASLKRRPGYARLADAVPTAEAQLAMAQAALHVGLAAGDTNALGFAADLCGLVLSQFRPSGSTVSPGIADAAVQSVEEIRGVRLWPEPATYSLKANARAYLLLHRLDSLAESLPVSTEWRFLVKDALRDQGAWLTNHILPHLLQEGIPPQGIFEIQDVHGQTTAYAAQPSTAAEDWLLCLEALDQMGWPRAQTTNWLDNLARVHGVWVGERWGLDWSIALRRPDAISSQLTARFARVARRLQHPAAAAFAEQQLAALQVDDQWPAVITDALPNRPLPTGQGALVHPTLRPREPASWATSLDLYRDVLPDAAPAGLAVASPLRRVTRQQADIRSFFWTAAGFYVSIVAISLGWWALRLARGRRLNRQTRMASGPLLSGTVMQRAEERWAKRVLGVRTPASAGHSRYSNGAVEQNFHMQLRAIYKLVLEWRRIENGWSEEDLRLVESSEDPWLNGMDEFGAMVGIYSRWVIKAGRKDGPSKNDVLEESEDSNHLWARLVVFFSEAHWSLLETVRQFKEEPGAAEFRGINAQIELALQGLGARARLEAFDAREAFDAPASGSALDLLLIQAPGSRLADIVREMERKLGIPEQRIRAFVKSFKDCKAREELYPVHPYLLEAAKILPHFLLMGLAGLIWYNIEVDGLRIYPYLKETFFELVFSPLSLLWALPISVGFGLSIAAYFLGTYRHRQRMRESRSAPMLLDATLTSFFTHEQAPIPATRAGRRWDPVYYERAGWLLRAVGFVVLAAALVRLETPSFAIFMFVKGVLAILLLAEAAATIGPLLISAGSIWLEDHASTRAKPWPLFRFLNTLNLPATRPASLIWLSIKYHFQPSVPTGGWWAMTQAIGFYLGFAAAFFFAGSYIFKEVLQVWFKEGYQTGWTWALVAGGFLFWNTMYLLRFGLFVLSAGVAAAWAAHPFRTTGALLAVAFLVAAFIHPNVGDWVLLHPIAASVPTVALLLLMAWEGKWLKLMRRSSIYQSRRTRRLRRQARQLEDFKADPNRALGIVYMSGDDLGFQKLTPELLVDRLVHLRDRLGSGAIPLLQELAAGAGEEMLRQRFARLYELESQTQATLWHPMQLVVQGEAAPLPPDLGLTLTAASAAEKEELLCAWHLRRWLVTMMSTAGHAQDTGINLVDIALALEQEGLGPRCVFYLIQNKYDGADHNRPSQVRYDQGELGQRNKLAQLLMTLAPGSRAYSVNDWTPFGFKAGGLVGMDLVYEESLKLTNMLIMDRNANVHDLDALLEDLKEALCDPGVIIVIPGRSTTNTLTPLGQGSQSLEEGHRALTKGVMMLGGGAGESVGTGWGNIQANYYGRVQRALLDPDAPKMPLTSRMKRGVPFGERHEGLIGFGPHAVGISEDIWGITQTTHNAVALGQNVKFRQSRALWHKIRETWSHAEWFSAFPRWSGGYLQMMLDPMMQRINDGGPLSVFAKEVRAHGGRFFLSAPFALLSILLMPLALIWNLSPFAQILIVLWIFGLLMNQVLTALGLVARLEASGFHRGPALAGGVLAGVACGLAPSVRPFAPGLILLAFYGGGFAAGLGQWWYDRGRDILLFGPQLIIHGLGQFIRQSLEFVLSGASANDAKSVNIAFRAWAGPREDRPFERYQNFVNLRTLVWGVGLVSFLLNLIALSQLDLLNVLLLLPSLLFSVSALVGPFLMAPKRGRDLGTMAWLPKALGWIAGVLFYTVAAGLMARPSLRWLGMLLLGGCVLGLFAYALRYAGYHLRLQQLIHHLRTLLVQAGLSTERSGPLADQIVCGAGADPAKARKILEQAGVSADAQEPPLRWLKDRLAPWLRRPLDDAQKGPQSRFFCEWSRSSVLSLVTFIWFFVVPIPGLLVFTAFDYRISMTFTALTLSVSLILGVLLVGRVSAALVEWWLWRGAGRRSVRRRLADLFNRFERRRSASPALAPLDIAAIYALFTDAQTYAEQRSYAYAHAALRQIEGRLAETR